MQCGCVGNWWNSTSDLVQASAPVIWNVITFWWEMRRGFVLWTWEQVTDHVLETLPLAKNSRWWPLDRKLMLMVFCISQGPICEHYLREQHRYRITVTSAFWFAGKWTVMGFYTKQRNLYRVFFVTWYCIPLYHCPYSDHPSDTKLQSSYLLRPGFWFRFVWTDGESNELQIMMMRARQCLSGFTYNGKSFFMMSSHSL